MKSLVPAVLVTLALLLSQASLRADGGGVKPADDGTLVDFSKHSNETEITPNNNAVPKLDADSSAVKVTLPAGKGFPGVTFKDPSGMWDLSAYKGVEAEVTNNGTTNVKISLRVDSGTDWHESPWDCEIVDIPPGNTVTIHVTFGMSYKQPDSTPKVQPDHVLQTLVFGIDPEAATDIVIKNLKAVK